MQGLMIISPSPSQGVASIKQFYLPRKAKGVRAFGVILLTENLRAQNVGRELVFSADLCYNRANEKPPSGREGDRVSGGRSLRNFEFGLISL